MNYLLIGMIVLLVLNIFFGAKNGLWNATVTFITLLLFVFAMNFLLPTYIQEDNAEESILESELNREKSMSDVIGILPDKVQEHLLQGYSSYDEMKSVDLELALRIEATLFSVGVIVVAIVALLFALFVLRPIGNMYDFVSKFPILKQFDRVIGMIIGAVNGIFMIYMILILIAAFSATKIGMPLYNMVQESEILMKMYQNNIVLKIFF